MKVLFLHTAQDGWTSEYKVHAILSDCARAHGLVPYFICQSPIDPAWMGTARIIAQDFGCRRLSSTRASRLRRWGSILRRMPRAAFFLAASVGEIKPDAIYTSQQKIDVLLGFFVSRLYGIPHIIHLHYNVGPWLGQFTLYAIRQSSRLIAVSEFVRQTALLQGIEPSKVHTVINPAPVAAALPQPDVAAIRAQFNVDPLAPVVLAVGRLDETKGYLDLVEAFARVIQKIPNARLLICGVSTSGKHYDAVLRRRVAELNLQSCIIFAGYRSDVRAIMRSSDVFCLPTQLDPCPLVFLEAMCESMPVVAYYSGGVPEIVQPNQTGLLSRPGDIASLAANLLKLLSDPACAKSMGAAGAQRAMTEFAPATIAERWLAVVQENVN